MQRSKVSTVERVRGLPIHDKDIAIGNDAASVPDRKRTASPVAFLCVSDFDAIDSDRQAVSADHLSGKCQHAFEHGNANRQVAIEIKEGSE